MPRGHKLVGIKQISNYLGCCGFTAQKLLSSKKIDAFKSKRKWICISDSCDNYLEKKKIYRLSVNIDKERKEKIAQKSAKLGISQSEFVRQILDEYFKSGGERGI